MINEQQIELLSERLMSRIDEANTRFLKGIGSSIARIKKLTPSQAYQLVQILKYGGNYDDIVRQISKYTNLNIKEIDKIFEEYAKTDQMFYQQFYKYRNVPFVEYSKNQLLQTQTLALSNITKEAMYNFARTNAIGYTINGQFYGLRDVFVKLLDTALLNVGQGKETFDNAVRNIIKEIGTSGLKTINYQSGRAVRLDSAVKQSLKDGLRNLHNENQMIYGKEFGADGVEISVHLNPAPDHEDVQGKQFSNEEFEKFQNDQDAVSYDGVEFPAEYDGRDRRSISQYNCYHYIFPIVLGVSKQVYSNDELKEIKEQNEKGFELDGKHYTNYEGTQLQRDLERKIREQKDIQILAKESDNQQLIAESQQNITNLTQKYKELSKVSGLPTKMEQLRVTGYKRTKINKTIPSINYDFKKYRDFIDNNYSLDIQRNFDYVDFMKEYNKFYNSLNKKELAEAYKNYEQWINNGLNGSHPIGDFLNKTMGCDSKPELIDKNEFLGKECWYRGISSDKKIQIEKYLDDFKNGKYYAGVGVNGNGTYATFDYRYAKQYAEKKKYGGMLYIMPKDNAKIIGVDKIDAVRETINAKLTNNNEFNKKDKLYRDFTNIIVKDDGYLAQVLGYDIVDLLSDRIILNRGSIKVVK